MPLSVNRSLLSATINNIQNAKHYSDLKLVTVEGNKYIKQRWFAKYHIPGISQLFSWISYKKHGDGPMMSKIQSLIKEYEGVLTEEQDDALDNQIPTFQQLMGKLEEINGKIQERINQPSSDGSLASYKIYKKAKSKAKAKESEPQPVTAPKSLKDALGSYTVASYLEELSGLYDSYQQNSLETKPSEEFLATTVKLQGLPEEKMNASPHLGQAVERWSEFYALTQGEVLPSNDNEQPKYNVDIEFGHLRNSSLDVVEDLDDVKNALAKWKLGSAAIQCNYNIHLDTAKTNDHYDFLVQNHTLGVGRPEYELINGKTARYRNRIPKDSATIVFMTHQSNIQPKNIIEDIETNPDIIYIFKVLNTNNFTDVDKNDIKDPDSGNEFIEKLQRTIHKKVIAQQAELNKAALEEQG